MPSWIVALLLQAASPSVPLPTASPPPASPSPALAPTDVARMAALYDEVCLQAFPIDAAVDALMAKKGARPMSDAAVKVTLREDPGRGWTVRDGDQTFDVVLELPPFHACSVRTARPTAGPVDLAPYRAVADAFAADHRGFAKGAPMDVVRGGIKIHGEMAGRALPGGSFENLLVIDQQVVDPALLEPGTVSPPLRFVHQIVARQ